MPKVSKEQLESFYIKYATEKFIYSDPIQFVYKFKDSKDKEIAGFIASTLAQGKRENIISKVNELLFGIMEGSPYEYLINFNSDNIPQSLKNFSYFAYRSITGDHIAYILLSLKNILKRYGNLKSAFYEYSRINSSSANVKEILSNFVDEFFSWAHSVPLEVSSLVPNPRKGSACKRLNMFLRWMVRKDKVDTGLWNDIIHTSKLIIPLDFHVSRISREMGLTQRKQDDWITAEEITNNLKVFDPIDPVKYDLAIFGYGLELSK